MSEMIERVARAICEVDKYAPEADAPIYIGMRKARAWEGRIEMARAAIAAIREPMEDQIAAAHAVFVEWDFPVNGSHVDMTRAMLVAAIDEALK